MFCNHYKLIVTVFIFLEEYFSIDSLRFLNPFSLFLMGSNSFHFLPKFSVQIPYIKQAVSLSNGVLKLFASPWSAPGWMKTSGQMIGGGALRGPPDGPYHVTWANHYVK